MNSRFGMHKLPVLAALLASGTVLLSQSTTGTLSGRVLDAKGKPVAGVSVHITSPALFAPRVLVSDDKGAWRAPALPPGNYKVIVSKANWIGASAENIRVGVGAMISQELTMKPVVVGEAVVEVTATNTAVVDKADTKVSVNFSADNLLVLPAANRSFEGAADLTPGVVTNANGNMSIGGGMTNSTLFRVDGVDIKNDLQGTRTGVGVMEDMIEDVQVITSPLNGRNGRTTGGSINVSKKMGGNEFAGSIRASFERNSWRGNKKHSDDATLDARDDQYGDRTYSITFMGPIIKDRLWFSFGTTLSPSTATVSQLSKVGTPESDFQRAYQTGNIAVDAFTLAGPAGYAWTGFDAGKYYNQMTDTKYYEGKLTFAVTSDHTLDLSMGLERDKSTSRDAGYTDGQLAMLGDQKTDRTIFGIGYRGLLTSNALLEASYNYNTNEIAWPGHTDSKISDPIMITNGRSGGTTFSEFTTPNSAAKEIRGSRSAKVNLKLYIEAMGNHDLDLGGDQYYGRYRTASQCGANNRRFYVGGAYTNGTDYRFPSIVFSGAYANKQNGISGPAPVLMQFYGQDGEANTINQGLYATDAWTINSNWNVMASVRADFFKVRDTDGATLAKSHAITPRFSVKYDPFGDSKHILTLTAARFADDFSTGFTRAFIKNATAVSVRSGWTGRALNQSAIGTSGATTADIVKFIGYSDLTNMDNFKLANGNFNIFQMTATSAYNIDPNLKVPTMDEITLGYVRNFGGGSKVGITLRSRTWHDQWAFGVDYTADQMRVMKDPTGSGKGVYVQQINVFNGDDLKRDYKALDIDFTHVLTTRWTIQGLVTYSRLQGNDQGGDDTTSSYRSNAATPYYYQPTKMAADGISSDHYSPYGFLANQQLLKARISLVGTFSVGKGTMTYAWMGSYDSGSRYTAGDTWALGITKLTTTDPTIMSIPAAPATRNEYYSGRGAYGYNDSFTVDFKLNWNFPIGLGKVRLIGDLSIFNFFNQQRQLTWDKTFTGDTNGAVKALTVRYPQYFGTDMAGTSTQADYYQSQRYASASFGFKF